jgi:hypothetical protein
MEISTFTLKDKKEIAIAFNGLNAVISRWEFSTQLIMKKKIKNNKILLYIILIINYLFILLIHI